MTTLRAREPRLHLPNVTMVVCSTLGIYWVGYRRCDTRCPSDIFGPPSHSKLTSNDDIINFRYWNHGPGMGIPSICCPPPTITSTASL